jgi:hypothetical protein
VAEEIDGATYTYFGGLFTASGELSLSRRVHGTAYTDDNAIFVSADGDDGNSGTRSTPKGTLFGAIASCDAAHPTVIILDSATYTEAPVDVESSDHCSAIIADIGQTPTISFTDAPAKFSLTSLGVRSAFPSGPANIAGSTMGVGMSNGDIVHLNLSGDKTYLNCYRFDAEMNYYGITQHLLGYTFSPVQGAGLKCIRMVNDDIFLYGACVNTGATVGYIVYLVLDKNLAVKVSPTVITSHGTLSTFPTSACIGHDDEIKLWWNSPAGVITVTSIDPDDYSVSSSTAVESMSMTALQVAYCNGHYFVYRRQSGYTQDYLRVYDTSYSWTGAYVDYAAPNIVTMCPLGDRLVISRSDASNYYYDLYDMTGATPALIGSRVTIDAVGGDSTIATFQDCDGNVRFHEGVSYWRKFKPGTYSLELQKDFTFEGVTFTAEDLDYYAYFLRGADDVELTFRWCTFSAIQGGGIIPTNPVSVYGPFTMKGCLITGGTGSVYVESTEVLIEDTQFIEQESPALYVKGAAASSGDIKVDHCDFVENYQGVKLEDNSGIETVKNSIVSLNNNFGIEAENNITISGVCYNDRNSGVTTGSNCIAANPQYRDEELYLNARVLGDAVDSPALDLADDSRNAGAHNVYYIIGETTWQSVTFRKPAKIERYIDFDGKKSQRRDGSVESYRDSMTEYLTITWEGMSNADLVKLHSVLTATSNEVRLYLNPTSEPASFTTYKVMYDVEFRKDAKHYKLTRTGVQGNKLTLARAYEVTA